MQQNNVRYFHPPHFRRAFLTTCTAGIWALSKVAVFFLFQFLFEDRKLEWIQHTPVVLYSIARSRLLKARNGTSRCP